MNAREPSTKTERDVQQNGLGAFAVRDCALIAMATGRHAWSLRELTEELARADADSLYYHFSGGLLQPTFVEREFNNDFATWARRSLHDHILTERLAVVNPSATGSMDELRAILLDIVQQRMDEVEERAWIRGEARFEFMSSQIVVFDTARRIDRPADLATTLPDLSEGSIFYHFIDARRRSPRGTDDFSAWLAGRDEGYEELRRSLADVDPYFATLAELRERLTSLCEEYFHANGNS